MLEAQTVATLPTLPPPVLTAYLNTNPANPRNQGHPPGYLIWLKSEAKKMARRIPREQKKLWKHQLERVEEHLRNHRPTQAGLVIFAGPKAWQPVPLNVGVVEELHWGEPRLTQLFWLLDEYRPCGVVTVNRGGARFFLFQLGEAHEHEKEAFHVDISAWRPKDILPPSHPGVAKSSGSQRDFFEQRLKEHFTRFYRDVAERVRGWSERHNLRPLLLVGPAEAVHAVASALPRSIEEHTRAVQEELAHVSAAELQKRIGPEVARWKRQRERALVREMFEAPQDTRTVLGAAKTLPMLQQGRVRDLVVARGLRGRFRQCQNCGWVEPSPDRTCRLCGGKRRLVEAQVAVPELARQHGARVEVVTGEAEKNLGRAGGLGAWLR